MLNDVTKDLSFCTVLGAIIFSPPFTDQNRSGDHGVVHGASFANAAVPASERFFET